MTHSCTLRFEIFHSTELWETPNFQRQTKKKEEEEVIAFPPDTFFLSVFLKWGRSAYWTESKWLTFRLSSLRALSFDGRCSFWALPLIAAGSSRLLSRPFFLMGAHACKNMYEGATRVNSPARSGCCFLLGLCSGPAVTSSLCLCCRWCASSLGYLSFCWRGTSLLFPLPVEIRKESK